jgi:hypothetical protein
MTTPLTAFLNLQALILNAGYVQVVCLSVSGYRFSSCRQKKVTHRMVPTRPSLCPIFFQSLDLF